MVRGTGLPPGRRRRAGTALLVVHRGDVSGSGPARVGLIVSSAVGNSVVRHRVTRRLRALCAVRVGALAEGTDVVVRATPQAAAASFAELAEALDHALSRIGR